MSILKNRDGAADVRVGLQFVGEVGYFQELPALQMFKDEGEALLGKPLPDMPAKGNLDVTVVRDSEFFFA